MAIRYRAVNVLNIVKHAYFSKISMFREHAIELRITSLSDMTLLFSYSI